jgi:hypothetical protein
MLDERVSGNGRGPGKQIEGERALSVSEVVPATYEPPRLTPLGNARDLLAGTSGTKFDAGTDDQTFS